MNVEGKSEKESLSFPREISTVDFDWIREPLTNVPGGGNRWNDKSLLNQVR